MRLFFETNHTARSGARSGVQTVVRGLIAGMSGSSDVEVVRWKYASKCLTLLKPEWKTKLDLPATAADSLPLSSLLRPSNWPHWLRAGGMNYKFPLHAHPAYREKVKGSWLMLLEIMNGSAVRAVVDYARNHEMKVAGIFHDAIPWLHPEYVRHRSRQEHADYMAAFAGLDVVIPVSRQAEKDYLDFLNSQHLGPPPLHTCTLPAEILGHARETGRKETASDVVRILYVSTLEPRKNHLLLLAAFDKVCVASAGQRLELHLVGNRYPGAPEIAEAVGVAIKKNPRIFWHEDTSHAELLSFYEACDFTVFVSSVEGFGLPVMESLWLARPCLCTDTGVVAENARDGGCLVVNVQDPQALTDGLWRLANQPDLRRDLTEEALMRKLKTWEGYADEILQILQEVERNPNSSSHRTALAGQ